MLNRPMYPTILQTIEMGDCESLRRLLLQGADFEMNDCTPLVYAVQCNQTEAARILLIAGSDPNARSGSAIISAASTNNVDIAEMLWKAGADIEIMDHCAYSVASSKKNLQMLEWFTAGVFKNGTPWCVDHMASITLSCANFFVPHPVF